MKITIEMTSEEKALVPPEFVVKTVKEHVQNVLTTAKVMRESSEMHSNEDAATFADKLQAFGDNMASK